MKVDLKKLHVESLVVNCLFQTEHVEESALKAAKDGVHELNLLITEMLDQGITPGAIKIEDLADMLGGVSAKKIRKDIKNAMKVARDSYKGTFDKPEVIEPDSELYLLAAIAIAEDGRMSNDLIRYTVRSNMNNYFDISAFETYYDFACFVALIDYFEDCLKLGRRIQISRWLKTYGSPLVSTRRMSSYLGKNWWYGNPEASESLFMLYTESPQLSSVTNAMLEVLEKEIVEINDRNFENGNID